MKYLNKLALVAAMAVSANVMALQSMDDESLSATTGQDGITLKVFTPGISIDKLLVHDNDGLSTGLTIGTTHTNPAFTTSMTNVVAAQVGLANAKTALKNAQDALVADPTDATLIAAVGSAQTAVTNANNNLNSAIAARKATASTLPGGTNLGGTENAGAIIINDVYVGKSGANTTQALAVVKIDTDGGVAADGSEATLNIGVDLAATDIRVGSIGVGKSNANVLTGARRGAVEHSDNVILENLNLSLGATSLNIQLGHQPQGALIVLDGTVTGGLTIEGLTLIDSNGVSGSTVAYGGAGAVRGDLTLDSIHLTDAGKQDLAAAVKINIDQNLGLGLTLSSANLDTYISGIHLGNTPSIGDVEIQGLDLGGTTLFVHGH